MKLLCIRNNFYAERTLYNVTWTAEWEIFVKNKLLQGQLKMIILMQCIKWLIMLVIVINKLMWYTDEFLLVYNTPVEEWKKCGILFIQQIIAAVMLHLNVPGIFKRTLRWFCSHKCVSPNKIAIEMLTISYTVAWHGHCAICVPK